MGPWDSPLSVCPASSETEDSSHLHHSNSFARPSGKSIYNQRKDYSQSLLKPQSNFQHHVEHLLTMRLDRDIRNTEDCLARLKALEAQGRVWGQDLILHVKNQELVLSDVESKEELESYPLGSVQDCAVLLDACSYDSVLAVTVQEQAPPGTSVLLFQCDRIGARTLKSSLEKLVKQCKEEQHQYGRRAPPEQLSDPIPPYMPAPYGAPERWAATPEPTLPAPPQRRSSSLDYRGGSWDHPPAPAVQQTTWVDPSGQIMSDTERDAMVLNHVLGDMELFVKQVKDALSLMSTKKQKKKKSKALPPEASYKDFFQKVKYALNLLGITHQHLENPDPPQLLHLIFDTLSFVLDNCPNPRLAPAVEAPLLIPEAVELLEKTLHPHEYSTWKMLGISWNKTRAEYPNSEQVPPYIPTFSDGWLPPPMLKPEQRQQQLPATSHKNAPSYGNIPGHRNGDVPGYGDIPSYGDIPGHGSVPRRGDVPGQVLARALYEFQGRNPQELSVRMGDTLEVLDQQKKWWLVQSSLGHKGYVPSNILEPLGHEDSRSQVSPPNLHTGSSPAEVTAWLKDKGFSRITVRCLGVLSGHQLLQMTPEELRAVCPEEGRRVLFKLSSVKMSLGMSPRD
ncbi:epidermal growth factor receptor kinase substrate 8-like protein 3 [Cygnus atratus]|uniref:epidermal growth factor receptor kinase substrate 8-like protein 3 n=1 Tax=Cygnus atratus TaxID=8868 RepID=UPI0015D601E4|nr:epidermal growth factor receptor kinase substrate 8-like protein 3 [Cygnus atratus]